METEKYDIDTVLQKLQSHCVGATNEIFECNCFNKRDRESNERIDLYVATFRNLARICNFG